MALVTPSWKKPKTSFPAPTAEEKEAMRSQKPKAPEKPKATPAPSQSKK